MSTYSCQMQKVIKQLYVVYIVRCMFNPKGSHGILLPRHSVIAL